MDEKERCSDGNCTWRSSGSLPTQPRFYNDWSALTQDFLFNLLESDKRRGRQMSFVADWKEALNIDSPRFENELNLQEDNKLYDALNLDDSTIIAVLKTKSCFSDKHFATKSEECQIVLLKKLFKYFISELSKGVYFTLLAVSNTCLLLHCQLTDNFQTLTVDPKTGEKVEFPLIDIIQICEVIQMIEPPSNEPHLINTVETKKSTTKISKVPLLDFRCLGKNKMYLVIFKFHWRLLAFVFYCENEAYRFKLCFDLLIHFVKTKSQKKSLIYHAFKKNIQRLSQSVLTIQKCLTTSFLRCNGLAVHFCFSVFPSEA
jgi:hypothetical protein